MRGRTKTEWWGVVLDSPDPQALAGFYSKLLGWDIATNSPDWVTMGQPNGVAYLAFQPSPEYVRPVWPPQEGQQQQMLHLDIAVDDLDAAVADAIEMGATPAEFQPQDVVRVMLDPDGHPFCLYLDTPED
jgi:catechol 2,3-dioxygenase-like lactoylglutathione lyase family enzyme